MTFAHDERELLARLADILIPASNGHPSASAAGVSGEGLDQILAACPEMAVGLRNVLEQTNGREPADAVAFLRIHDAAAYGVLCEFAAGAYFMNPQIREAVGYGGQTARAIDPTPDYLDLLEPVLRRGPIYRR